jgi:hypothetical protein
MDIIQGLIDTGNAGKSGWRIVNNGGAIGVLNNRTSNVSFSILNEGIGTSSNVSSTFINTYSGINVSNYTGSGSTSTSVGSLWSSNVSGSKIYYNSGNIGIGATDPIAPLHIYNTSNTRLLLDATTTGTASVEFRRGVGADALNDYRFINDSNNSLKLQYENSTQSFGNTIADLAWFSSNDTIIHKNTSFNGRVGIGTVYHTTRSLDVLGDTNVSGTVSVGGLSISGVSGVTSNAMLTNSITSNTSFTIHNGLLPPLPNEIVVAGTTSGTIGTDRFISFLYSGTAATKDYSFTTTESIVCDILIVGGGGAGSGTIGGGGGAGALIFARNATLNGTYTVNVGNGGIGGSTGQGTKGNSSRILQGGINITAEGGGASGRADGNQNGGSGGGGDYWEGNQSGGTFISYTSTAFGASIIKYGNNGANAYTPSPFNGGGGGGAGSSALIATSTNLFSNGGIGLYQVIIDGITINFATHFGTNTADVGGVLSNGNIYYCGGGAGGGNETSLGGTGGIGGGGDGGRGSSGSVPPYIPIHGSNGLPNTGGGGGGGSNHPSLGGKGGSGIVIIRYRLPNPTSSSINLIRGTTADTNNDYKVGNFNGEFKVISSVSSVDTDYIRITTAGAITNPSGTANWNTGSDRRIKENIKRASYDKCLENINRLELNCFNYVEGFNTVNRDKTQLGFIAQEVSAIFPKSISTQGYNSDTLSIPNLMSIDISQINYALYGAVKKLIEINDVKDTCFKAMDEELKELELTLNITPEAVASSSNLVLEETVATTSNLLVEPLVLEQEATSNLLLEPLVLQETVATTSNIILEPLVLQETVATTSNLLLEPLVLQETVATTSNILLEPLVLEETVATTSNLIVEPLVLQETVATTSNLLVDAF